MHCSRYITSLIFSSLCDESKASWPVLKEVHRTIIYEMCTLLFSSSGCKHVFNERLQCSLYYRPHISSSVRISNPKNQPLDYYCSYHHNAFFMQQAGEVVRRTPDSEKSNMFEKYIQFAFDNQDGELDDDIRPVPLRALL